MSTIYSNNETININPTDDLVLYKEEFINSRIEKFLYAICALDFDDLPTPLSRIEELYKCLATGLPAPTFVPQSRVEKYLMAILGAYDASALPAPKSRTEVLLSKILLGDTDLSDIEWLKSRYEFLLAYIAKGGENDIDKPIYFVNYSLDNGVTTLYNTINYPVKNAVLKGQTLVNLVDFENNLFRSTGIVSSNESSKIIFTTATTGKFNLGCSLPGLKNNTKYILKLKAESSLSADVNFYVLNITGNKYIISSGVITDTIYSFTTDDTAATSQIRLGFQRNTSVGDDTITAEAIIVEYQEGMENWDIPYFEGMASVKMPVLTTTGKNLINPIHCETGGFDHMEGKYNNNDVGYARISYENLIRVKPNTGYHFNNSNWCVLVFFDEFKNAIGRYTVNDTSSFITPDKCVYIRFRNYNSYETSELALATLLSLQLEEGSTATSYEPHKSTTVSCNEEVELRGIGDVKDELNLLTGEVVNKFGEIVLNGDENWSLYGSQPNQVNTVAFKLSHTNHVSSWGTGLGCCDKIPFTNGDVVYGQDLEGVTTDANNIIVRVSKTKASSVDEFKAWLSNHNIRVVYPLKEEVIKTVDLSTLDQDGKETELSTFDDITYVTVSSEGLVPTGDIDIARPIQFVDYSLDSGLTTLYNTLDYPFKNAVLRGQTLVNLAGECRHNISTVENPKVWAQKRLFLTNVKSNTIYTMKVKMTEKVSGSFGPRVQVFLGDTSSGEINTSTSDTLIFTSPSVLSSQPHLRLITTGATAEQTDVDFEILLLEGEFPIEYDIPYFDGMMSVKMPVLTTYGKNLFDVSRHGSLTPQPTGDIQLNSAEWGKYDVKYLLKPNTQYTLTILGDGTKCWIAISVDGSSQSSNVETSYTKTFSTNSNGEVTIGIYANSDKYVGYSRKSISIEEGTVSTPYEPYKSNILTCNEDVTLRGIGDIKDELNTLTGELTQRIGEFVLDGSSDELWSIDTNTSGLKRFVCAATKTYSNYSEITNWLPTTNKSYWSLNENGFYIGANGRPVIVFNTNDSRYNMSITEFKNYLSQNPLIVQYQSIESVKTVDLSTVDQDGKETELSTFDDITYAIVSSEGLAPTGEITVATKNSTDVIDAGIMSLRMDDISNSQTTLEESANAQSDDIDVTMLGVTDIYEQLL